MTNIDQAIPEGAEYANNSDSAFFKIADNVIMVWSVKRPEVGWRKHHFQNVPVFLKLPQVVRLVSPQTVEKSCTFSERNSARIAAAEDNIRPSDKPGIPVFSFPPPPITPAPAFMVKPALRADGLDVIATDSRKFVWGAKL